MLQQSVERYGDDPMIWFRGMWLSFKDVSTQVDRLAATLYQLGRRKGEIVMVQLTNSPQFVIAFYAILAVGGIVLPMDPNFTSAEMDSIIQFSAPKMAVIVPLGRNTRRR